MSNGGHYGSEYDNGDRITIADSNLRHIRYGVFQGRVPSIKGAVGRFVGVSTLVMSLESILKFVHISKNDYSWWRSRRYIGERVDLVCH